MVSLKPVSALHELVFIAAGNSSFEHVIETPQRFLVEDMRRRRSAQGGVEFYIPVEDLLTGERRNLFVKSEYLESQKYVDLGLHAQWDESTAKIKVSGVGESGRRFWKISECERREVNRYQERNIWQEQREILRRRFGERRYLLSKYGPGCFPKGMPQHAPVEYHTYHARFQCNE